MVCAHHERAAVDPEFVADLAEPPSAFVPVEPRMFAGCRQPEVFGCRPESRQFLKSTTIARDEEVEAAIDFDASGGLTATVRIGGPVPQKVSVAFGPSECEARSGGRVICKDSATPTRLKHRVILRTTSSGDQKVKAYFAGLDINHGISAPVELELTADGTTVSGSSSNCRGGTPPRSRIACK
jgi:hypothetical protein